MMREGGREPGTLKYLDDEGGMKRTRNPEILDDEGGMKRSRNPEIPR